MSTAMVDEEITYLTQTLVQINYKPNLEAKKWEELAESDWDNYSSSAQS